MKLQFKLAGSIAACILVLILGVGVGSVFVPPQDIVKIILSKIAQKEILSIQETFVAIVWNVRLPRVLVAFLAGGALAVSGAVMQSILKNALASSYTMGVSSGSSLGAALVILTGLTLPLMPAFTLPLAGTIAGLLTVYTSVKFAALVDRNFENSTIILAGIVFSLFINGIITVIIALNRDGMARLIFWQMGSFASQNIKNFNVLLPICAGGTLILTFLSHEMDLLTFGEEQARTMGVNTKKIKWSLLFLVSALTGAVISFVGIIGFIDLIAPHLVRKLFGARHKIVIPMSFCIGGTGMVLCDMIARTILSPQELPVGAITALAGAPFFCYVYFKGRRRA
ncbi:iron ABC transporter permease [Treponema sp. OMZ 799]|uniref:FecCD family ABC transporter permease n=1 Tax=Treponema sp. OMZ 799 TaxID=2563668 RepID=UPI0020A2E51E|nr:iron ABC transporter permease [Treponema sp. OMZ 799]UTC78584.1 iron ABC transporter permease [Treponema sp. OMZ 799]